MTLGQYDNICLPTANTTWTVIYIRAHYATNFLYTLQLIDWKDSSPKWPILCRMGR